MIIPLSTFSFGENFCKLLQLGQLIDWPFISLPILDEFFRLPNDHLPSVMIAAQQALMKRLSNNDCSRWHVSVC